MREGKGLKCYDIVGNAHGTISGPTWVNTDRGRLLDFGGDTTADHVLIPYTPHLNLTGNTLSISAFCYAHAINGSGSRIICKREQAGGDDAYDLELNPSSGNEFRFRINGTAVDSDFEPALNTWHHAVGVYNGSQFWIHWDKDPNTKDNQSSNINSSTTPITIGMRNSEGREWDGNLYDIRIWDRPLSQEEVNELFEDPWGALAKPGFIFIPQAAGGTTIAAASADSPLTGEQATVVLEKNVDAASADSPLTGEQATVQQPTDIDAASADSPLSADSATLILTKVIDAASADSPLTGEQATVTQGQIIEAGTSDSPLTGEQATVDLPQIDAASSDSVLTGEQATIDSTEVTVGGFSVGYVGPKIIRAFAPMVSEKEVEERVEEIISEFGKDLGEISLELGLPIEAAKRQIEAQARNNILVEMVFSLYQDNKTMTNELMVLKQALKQSESELNKRIEILEHNAQAALVMALTQ